MDLAPTGGEHKRSLIEFLVSHQDQDSTDEFLDILGAEAARVESKFEDIFAESPSTTLLDLDALCLSGERLAHWRSTVVTAPNVVDTKVRRNIQLPHEALTSDALLHAALAKVIMYDKHGLLQLILYEDGREEARKPARKRIGEMTLQEVLRRLQPWVGLVAQRPIAVGDLAEPKSLRVLSDAVAQLASNAVAAQDFEGRATGELRSLARLMMDVGEAITRCEVLETYISTSLFLFWTAEYIYGYLGEADQLIVQPILAIFLRNYVASVLLVDAVRADKP
jgi:hypothetical protein